jgi:DNA segregation ATPase FtsK/SpoIIIE-like protein
VNQTLALLDSLGGALRDFAASEEQLNGGFRAGSAAETKTFEAAMEAHESQLAEALTHEETAFQTVKENGLARFEKRKRWINQAHMASRKRAMEAIRDQEGRQKYKIQESSLGAERLRNTDLATADATREAFHIRLTQSREEFSAWERAALGAFRGYAKFRKLLAADRPADGLDLSPDENQLLDQLDRLQVKIEEGLDRFRGRLPLRMLGLFPLWLAVLLFAVDAAFLAGPNYFALNESVRREAGISVAIALAVVAVLRLFVQHRAQPAAASIAGDLVKARHLHQACFEKAESRYQQELERIKNEFENKSRSLGQDWRQAIRGAIEMLDARPKQIDEQAPRVTRKNEQLHRARIARIEQDHATAKTRLANEGEIRKKKLAEIHEAKMAKLAAEYQTRWLELEAEWKNRIQPLNDAIAAAGSAAAKLFPDWESEAWQQWTPPREFVNAARFGRLEVDLKRFAEAAPRDQRLVLPGPAVLSLPLALAYPLEGSILFETGKTGDDSAVKAINNIIFRLLSITPPGKLSFTIFDPVGLGESFAALMHLADYEEGSINSRIWTQPNQFEEKLAELNEHMEKVIQMYLRNEYATITEYNAQAGSIAEKYHFLVVASFPVNFSDTAARRLRNRAASGARCGVYTLVHWDQRKELPHEFVPDELRKNSVCLVRTDRGFELSGWRRSGTQLSLDPPPSPEIATRFLHDVGRSSKDSTRVEVPFEQVAPPDSELWTEETTEELQVPIGRSGATKLQYLEIGKGTRQHALIAGKTGSGKSTLFHVIITNLALWCSPEQVEFYLVDFKKGVEFKSYASRRLPHAKVVAIESDRQFGLSVLQRVDEELRRRGDLFRELGVQDLAGYKKAGGSEPMPRSLLIIDEFQEFFTEEDRVSQGAAVLLDRIVRQGRAFGIHVLLGSQTLGGAYTLARATIGQMVIRIALQCNEADAYLIMDQDNPAPRLLTRPGEGIYNDTAGSIEGNSPFQTVWLPEDVRDRYLARIRERADKNNGRFPGPFVFEGNAPADVRENVLLRASLETKPVQPPAQSRTWLGSPNSIKGPTEAVFQRQSGNNLLIVGQSEERSLTLLAIALVSLAAQYPKGTARFIVLDSTPPGFPQRELLQRILQTVPHELIQVNNSNLAETMAGLAEELKQRADDESAAAPETFVLIHGLQNYKKLRQEDEFGLSSSEGEDGPQPAAVLQNLISEGSSRGFHIIATCDTYNNVNRFLGRKTLTEFEMRVLFQMSASDSASLIDAPDASTLGLQRALFYNDREGYLETFRPYALPDNEWIEEATRKLAAGTGPAERPRNPRPEKRT